MTARNGLANGITEALHTADEYTVSVDLGERHILVLQFKHVMTPEMRTNIQAAMTQIAAQPGRQTLILENGCQYSVIRRPEAE